ncbi:MAG: hypothetical protein Q8R78_04965 [Candidatus Omnitrophota bacterium]|nr:hypothetical protein [Candidatus Omnitrophota bacterium]
MADSERLAVLEERLSNLIEAFESFCDADALCFSEFRQEQQARFDKLEEKLLTLQLWRSGIMWAWGLVVLLWGGLIAWIKFGQGKP